MVAWLIGSTWTRQETDRKTVKIVVDRIEDVVEGQGKQGSRNTPFFQTKVKRETINNRSCHYHYAKHCKG